MTKHLCPICRTNERSMDGENGIISYFSTCESCFHLVADAPWCYGLECRVPGTRTQLVNGYNAAHGFQEARYSCPNGCGTATRIGWAVGSGRQHGTADAQRKLAEGDTLVDVRLTTIGKDIEAKHPVRQAYAKAYVQAAKATLAS